MSDDNHLSSGATSTSLLERVKIQDQDAWRKLAELYGPLVYHWCRRWGLAAVDSQDVVQEVFRAVATSIGRFRLDHARGTFRGWLWTITRNEAREHLARQGKRPRAIGGTDWQATLLHIPEQYPDDEDSADAANDRASLMHRALGAIRGDFHQRTWQAFWNTTVEGKAAAEVARDLGMTSRAVRQAKHRVLQRLREEYRGLIEAVEKRP